jgi:hypothetical protein
MEVIAVGVHRVPGAAVAVDRELAVARQPAERLELEEQAGVLVEVVEDPALEDEEAARDPSLTATGTFSWCISSGYEFWWL